MVFEINSLPYCVETPPLPHALRKLHEELFGPLKI